MFFQPFYTRKWISQWDDRMPFGCHGDSRWEGKLKSKHLMFTCVQMKELDACCWIESL